MADASSFHSLTPSGTSFISDGDNTLRTNFGVLDRALTEEHYFSASASSNSAGIHLPGSARIYFGTASQLSSPAANARGRLMLADDQRSIHYFGASSHSTLLGGIYGIGTSAYSLAFPVATAGAVVSWDTATAAGAGDMDPYDYFSNASTIAIPVEYRGPHIVNVNLRVGEVTNANVLPFIALRNSANHTIALVTSSTTTGGGLSLTQIVNTHPGTFSGGFASSGRTFHVAVGILSAGTITASGMSFTHDNVLSVGMSLSAFRLG